MATVLGLALKVTADAAGLAAQLSPVDKALQGLGDKATAAAQFFDKFLSSTSGAGDAQAAVRQQFEALAQSLQSGEITAQQYAAAFKEIQTAARQTADQFKEGAAVTERYRSETSKVNAEVERFSSLLKVGAIDQQTYEAAINDVTGANERAAQAEKEREQFLQRAAQLTQAVISPMERYDAQVQELNTHLAAGTITQQTYDKQLQQATQAFTKAESSAQGYDKAVESAGKGGVLAFNELSGILSAIPGPIGNIAGRLSGLSSAAEGLGRVFSSGLGSGISSIGASIAALANPFTLAIAGIAAFGAAAAAIGAGLSALSSRVEQLQNTASRLGTSFEFVQVLEEAASRSGVSIDQLASGLQKFAVNVDKAREGGNTAAGAFDRLGISQQELFNTDPTELAVRVAEALGEIEDPAERARIATELLGKSGLELLPAFASIDPATKALDKFRATIDIVEVGKLAELDDVFDDIGVALRGLGTQLLLPFTGLAAGVADAMTEAISGITRFIDPILDAIEPVLDGLGVLISDFASSWADAAEAAGNAIGGFIEVVVRLGTIVGAAVTETIEYVGDLLAQFGEFTGLGGTVSAVASAIAGAFLGLWDGIKNVVGTVGGFIEQVLQFAEDWLGIERGVDAANDAYRGQEKIVRDLAKAQEEKAKAEEEAARKAVEANTKIADSLLEQLDIEERFGGDSARAKAAENVEAIEKEIARVREEVEKARAAGDNDAVRAGTARLGQLDQVQARQEDIASGAAKAREDAAKAAADAAKEQARIDGERKKRDEELAKQIKENQKQIFEAQQEYNDKIFEIEKARIDELNTLRGGAVDINDIRNGGADTLLDLLGGREDAAIAEYKKQLGELKELRKDIRNALAKKAEILGAK